MSPLHLHHAAKLKCPYKGCGKSFERPTILTDPSTIPRKTFYACPYCMSKIDMQIENLKVVDVKAIEYGKVFDSPAKCAHYSGFINSVSKDIPVPDECLICPKILQCSIKKQRQSFF
jgi:DNA-directed RNA polymerase subunit RPC12/RpoP